MSTPLRHRATAAVRERYHRSALARYGAGLHLECDECAVGTEVHVPSPRRRVVVREGQAAGHRG